MKKVGIIMGSDSDLPVIRKAADTLKALFILRTERRRRRAVLHAKREKMILA